MTADYYRLAPHVKVMLDKYKSMGYTQSEALDLIIADAIKAREEREKRRKKEER